MNDEGIIEMSDILGSKRGKPYFSKVKKYLEKKVRELYEDSNPSSNFVPLETSIEYYGAFYVSLSKINDFSEIDCFFEKCKEIKEKGIRFNKPEYDINNLYSSRNGPIKIFIHFFELNSIEEVDIIKEILRDYIPSSVDLELKKRGLI